MASGFGTGIWLVGVCIFLRFSSAKGAGVTLRNHCESIMSVYWHGEPSPFVLQPDKPNPIDLKPDVMTSFSVPSGESNINLWACTPVNKHCNAGNNAATVAALSMGNETNLYQFLPENGFNFNVSIMALGPPTMCPTITCKAKLADCPAELQVTDSIGNIIACRSPPDPGESKPLIDAYFSMVKDCRKDVPSTCDAGVYLIITFCAK